MWTVDSSGGSILTLAVSSGTPTVTVTNIASLTAPLAGTAGLERFKLNCSRTNFRNHLYFQLNCDFPAATLPVKML
jgi:hypothetical protein